MPKTPDADWDDGPGLLEIAIRYWWLLLVCGLVCALALFLYVGSRPLTYAASSSLLLQEPETESVFADPTADDHNRYVNNQVKRLQSREVAEGAAEIVGGGFTADDILEKMALAVEVDNDLVTITGYGTSPEQAATIANAVGESYQNAVRVRVGENADAAISRLDDTADDVRGDLRRLQTELDADADNTSLEVQRDALVAQLSELNARKDQISIDASLYGSGVELFEEAVQPLAPQPAGQLRMTALGLLLGVGFGMAIAWLLASREDHADRRQDPAAVLQAPLLGAVPDFRGLDIKGTTPTITDPRSPAAEAYQFVVASLATQFGESASQGGRVVLVTSPQPGDGKTVTALNIAVAASRDERDVLLVDGDARVAGLTRMTGFSDGPGLHELQQDPENLVWSESRRDMPEVPSLEVVPVGSDIADPAGFFRTVGFAHAVRRIRDYADLVIIDSPPLLAVSDTAAAAELVDGIILVIAQGTPLSILEETRERLQLIRAPLLGYIFNRADSRSAPYAYRYDRYSSETARHGEAVSVKASAQPLRS